MPDAASADSLSPSASLLEPPVKGLRLDESATAEDLFAGRPALTGELFSWPLLTLAESALEHNIATMAALCAEHGVLHAPHVKTAMSPQLYARQQAAGVWGATVATPFQLRTVRGWGAQQVMLANEFTDPREARWLRTELESAALAGSPGTVWVWVDSARGVELLAEQFSGAGQEILDQLGILVELGVPGGRTGLRTVSSAVEIARMIRDAGLPLLGVAGYEGPLVDHDATPGPHTPLPREPKIREYVRSLRALADRFVAEQLVADGVGEPGQEVVVTVGGSDVVDVILDELGHSAGYGPVRGVIRSGAYLTHDHGLCARANPWQLLGARMRPAATVWGSVVSAPEEGLALVNVGRRDVPFDIDLPVVLSRRELNADGGWTPAGELPGWQVTNLNDQHAYLRASAPGGASQPGQLQVGDVVGLGISHPCTLFDKWRVAVLTDEADRAVGAVTTQF